MHKKISISYLTVITAKLGEGVEFRFVSRSQIKPQLSGTPTPCTSRISLFLSQWETGEQPKRSAIKPGTICSVTQCLGHSAAGETVKLHSWLMPAKEVADQIGLQVFKTHHFPRTDVNGQQIVSPSSEMCWIACSLSTDHTCPIILGIPTSKAVRSKTTGSNCSKQGTTKKN